MKKWWQRNYKVIIISAFLIPIITVALVSISHVTVWYGISNPMTWAVYLSIGIEIAALSALAAISADMGKKVYLPFGIVTLIQFIGNIFFSYQFIDINREEFKEWVELVSPLLEYISIESDDFIGHKRFLSLFSGGMLPIISMLFLHMLVVFTRENKVIETPIENTDIPVEKVKAEDLVGEISRVRLSKDELDNLENLLKQKESKKKDDVKIQYVENPQSEQYFNDLDDLLVNDSKNIIEPEDQVQEYQDSLGSISEIKQEIPIVEESLQNSEHITQEQLNSIVETPQTTEIQESSVTQEQIQEQVSDQSEEQKKKI